MIAIDSDCETDGAASAMVHNSSYQKASLTEMEDGKCKRQNSKATANCRNGIVA